MLNTRKARVWLCALVLGLLVIVGGTTAEAADSEEIRRSIDNTPFSATWNWLEEQRDDVSRNVTNVGRYLDDWLVKVGWVSISMKATCA